jgi:hypothetical protein
MKKFTCSLFAFVFGISLVFSKTVPVPSAQIVAKSFYQQTCVKPVSTFNLFHTEASVSGEPYYYVFNVNTNDGFVIIAADDAAHPIIGYSHEGQYILPEANTTFDFWMKERVREIAAIRSANVPADNLIAKEWSGNFFNPNSTNRTITSDNSINTVVTPLCQTTWNQSPNYNALCPGGSVTGCVATAMAQIMKYWNYPNTGTGSSSYCDCTSQGFTMNYGTLTANYAAATYSWANMPNSLSGSNTAVATLMSHCGISVDMDYSPSGSGAWVITSDNPICAQNSYTTYFKYDPSSIQGLMRVYYTDPNWIALLENELNEKRLVQYAGYESNGDGHTWVVDGYDASNNFHMNWGWGGYDNGYYSINLMNPNPYNFLLGHEALIGIRPLPYANFALANNAICAGQTISLSDMSQNTPTAWSYTLTGGTPSISSVQNPTVTYLTPGVYSITLVTSNITNTSVPMVKTITVSSTPMLTVSAAPICAGNTATINSSGAFTYTLNTNATGSSILVTPVATTNYTVTGFNGCVSTQTVDVIVNPMPNVNIASNSTSVCAGNTVSLNASGAATYSWNTGSTANAIVVTPTASTVYLVNGTTGMCTKTASASIAYVPVPNITASGIDSSFCAGETITLTATGALTYTWSTGSNAPIITDSPMSATTYTVTGSNAAGCSSSIILVQTITAICAGIEEHKTNTSISVYPNPTKDDLTVILGQATSSMVIEVFNSLGQLIVKQSAKSLNNTVSLVNETSGIYQLRITDGGNPVYKAKIIKQ